MSKIIDGKKIADKIRDELWQKIATSVIKPGLAAILVGNNPESKTYVALKQKASAETGIYFEKYEFSKNAKNEDVIRKIEELNVNNKIHGILVQLPLPAHLDTDKIIKAIKPTKDADGFHPVNIKKFLAGDQAASPVLVSCILELLASTNVNLKGKRAYILAKSPVFISPLKKALENISVKSSSGIKAQGAKAADILIAAIGKPCFVQPKDVKKDVIVIDVGYNRLNTRVVGDVQPQVLKKASFFTPVPGGVGPMTVAMLLKRTYELAVK